MVILTNHDLENQGVVGVFSSADKAKAYVRTVLKHRHLNWSDPAENKNGASWVNSGAVTLSIVPVRFDPAD